MNEKGPKRMADLMDQERREPRLTGERMINPGTQC